MGNDKCGKSRRNDKDSKRIKGKMIRRSTHRQRLTYFSRIELATPAPPPRRKPIPLPPNSPIHTRL